MISLSYPFFNSLEINFQTQSPSLVGSVNIAGTTAEIILRIHAVHVCPQRYVVGRTEHSHAVKADAAGQGLRQCIGKGDVLHAEIRRVDQVTVENNRLGVDRKSTRLNSSHANISYAVFCLKKKKNITLHARN